jgi:hypothetical protein
MSHHRDKQIEQELLKILEKPVEVKKLIDNLFFNADDLEDAALHQPGLRLKSGKFRAQTMMRLKNLQRKLGRISAEKSLDIRHRKSGLTETAIKGRLSLDKDVQSAQRKADYADVYDEFAKQLVEAAKERGMVIAILIRLRASETSSEVRSVKNSEESERMHHRAHKVRSAYEELEG